MISADVPIHLHVSLANVGDPQAGEFWHALVVLTTGPTDATGHLQCGEGTSRTIDKSIAYALEALAEKLKK